MRSQENEFSDGKKPQVLQKAKAGTYSGPERDSWKKWQLKQIVKDEQEAGYQTEKGVRDKILGRGSSMDKGLEAQPWKVYLGTSE